MTWTTPNIQIGPVIIDLPQGVAGRHSYEDIGGVATFRTGDGKQRRRGYWIKVKVTMEGEGLLPPGISDIDWTQPQVVKCAKPRSIYAASNVQTIPVGRRDDAPVTAVGWVGGFPVLTPVEMSGNLATATVVDGAVGYEFFFLPMFTAFINKSESHSRPDGRSNWSFTAEEI